MPKCSSCSLCPAAGRGNARPLCCGELVTEVEVTDTLTAIGGFGMGMMPPPMDGMMPPPEGGMPPMGEMPPAP